MANNKTLYIIVAVLALVVIGGGLFFLTNNKNAQEGAETNPQGEEVLPTANGTPSDKQTMVDCGTGEKDPFCFQNRMNECLPTTVKMMGSDGTTNIELIILGIENDTCHFQRKINNALNLNCFFPKGTMNMDTLNQTFGNEMGLQAVVDAACKGGW
ncbi:MAG: hypothetical protein A2Y84_00315 [Candidatus Colwellbacteria bacterium RBG_13_48_8]|uniref:Uncharacterized protein n=1 Tax=Candidatus Colwellbacteria bacterium RBG_13_48_8 TaxID=1797685 RepID=A0A1G1YXI8_9BACT|nr:MAG: hypothetical protein A2Y84_00315 [Candidatus Colwellbacteria bacterium RBG_13_48_8]